RLLGRLLCGRARRYARTLPETSVARRSAERGANAPRQAEAAMSVTFEDIQAARARIAPAIVRTPLLHSAMADDMLGARLLVKAECLQRFGAFKIRGAYNCIAALAPVARSRGVIAFSSGNHGIAVAGAAKDFDVPAVIVMPADAPKIKADTIRALGG